MNIAIVGSRDFNDFYLMDKWITSFIKIYRNDVIISGGASGADLLAEKFADKYGLKKKIFKADWDQFGKSAGFMRNEQIIEAANICFVFKTHEDSRGSNHDIQLAQEKGIPCHVYKTY